MDSTVLETLRIVNELIALGRRPIHWIGADISAAAVDLMLGRQPFPGSKVQFRELTLRVRKPVNMQMRNLRHEKGSLLHRTALKAALSLLEAGKDNIFSPQHITKMKEDSNGMSFEANDARAFERSTGDFG